MTGRIAWTMGDGKLGSTFLLQAGADWFESQLSYYTATGKLDLTPGHASSPNYDLERAFGERQTSDTTQHCFACHTTTSSVKGRFDPGHAIPGLTCEACHGPGAQHIRAMQEGRVDDGREAIFNPAALSATDQVDFCGACHRSPADVRAARDFFPPNIRFQPYRLAKSRCWTGADARLSCVACHDPHENLVQDVKAYDAKCLACHARAGSPASYGGGEQGETASAAACKRGTERCVTCHMPRYQVEGMHGSFTDHFIRIVRPGEVFPL